VFAVRPEKVDVVTDASRTFAADKVVARGVVAAVVYAGPVTRYLVDLVDPAGGRITSVSSNHSSAEDLAGTGDAVRLVLDRRHCRQLDGPSDDPASGPVSAVS
jgi:putative spermidine/putrescine transport system ATP-binding protein